MKIVVVGNVVDGLSFYGPITDEEAEDFPNYFKNEEWIIADITHPSVFDPLWGKD